MTLTELVTFIRQRHNAVGDSFWSDAELYNLIWAACLEMAREALVIENTYTTSTVAGTQEYTYPTNAIGIKRVTWDGAKLKKISFREDDSITGQNAETTGQGNPAYYFIWNDTIYLRPIPSSVATLKIFTFNEPQALSTTSSLEIPRQFHVDVADYVLSCMHSKEKNYSGAQYYRNLWDKKLLRIKAWQRKRLRTDDFAAVNDTESLAENFVGSI